MKVKYDIETDILRIRFSEKPISESDEARNGIIIDYDESGNVIGIEIMKASLQMPNPRIVEYEVA